MGVAAALVAGEVVVWAEAREAAAAAMTGEAFMSANWDLSRTVDVYDE